MLLCRQTMSEAVQSPGSRFGSDPPAFARVPIAGSATQMADRDTALRTHYQMVIGSGSAHARNTPPPPPALVPR